MNGKLFLIICAFLSAVILYSCGEEPVKTVKATPSNIDSLLNLYPDSVPLLIMRGNIALDDYRYYDALADGAKAFRLDSNNLEARMLYALAQNNKSTRTVAEIADAQRHFNYIVKQDPKNTDALVALATTYGQQQDYEKAFYYVNKALRLDVKKRDAYILKGSMYLAQGNMTLAKSNFETAIQQDPEFYYGYIQLGALYHSEGDSICLEYYRSAYEIKKSDPETIYTLAYALESFKRLDEAKSLYREMAALEKNNYYASRGNFHLGNVKQNYENEIDSALFFYSKAIDLKYDYVEAYHNRGICYEIKGDKQSALFNFTKALEYGPDFDLTKEAIEKYK